MKLRWMIASCLIIIFSVSNMALSAVDRRTCVISDVSTEGAISLAGEWKFRKISSVTAEFVSPKFNDSAWRKVNAPADWTEQGVTFNGNEAPLVLYRKFVKIPAVWKGQSIGISCWFARNSNVYINGVKVEPQGPLYARFTDVSKLVLYGHVNLLAVAVMYESHLEAYDLLPPRIGLLTERTVPAVLKEDVMIPGENGSQLDGTVYYPPDKIKCPALIMVATVHHDSVIKDVWSEIADDLARSGYVCLALQGNLQETNISKATDYLCQQPAVDSGKIGIIGASTAGKVCLLTADHDPRLRMAIILSGPKITPEEAKLAFPVLLIASTNDARDPLAFYAEKAVTTLGKPGRVLILPDQEHGIEFFDTKWNTVRRAVLDWLTQYLPTD